MKTEQDLKRSQLKLKKEILNLKRVNRIKLTDTEFDKNVIINNAIEITIPYDSDGFLIRIIKDDAIYPKETIKETIKEIKKILLNKSK